MQLNDAEDLLYERMSSARDTADLHIESLDLPKPGTLAELTAVGIDTNILKALRRDLTFADQLFVTLESDGVGLIAPAQSVVEFWNNHKVFSGEEWTAFRNDFQKLTKRIESEALGARHDQAVQEVRGLIEMMSDDVQEAKSPEYLSRSKDLIRSLLTYGSKPMVSRERFSGLASVRHTSKIPPGFSDERSKSSPHGDFFVWCEFLLGALCVRDDAAGLRFGWFTDDSKPDWKTGGGGHPALIEEFRWITGGELSILGLDDLRSLFKASERHALLGDAGEGNSQPDGVA